MLFRSILPAPGRRKNPPAPKADPGLDAPRRFALELERGDRYYLAPLLEKGLIVRTNPEHPNSPHQEYGARKGQVCIASSMYCVKGESEKTLLGRGL